MQLSNYLTLPIENLRSPFDDTAIVVHHGTSISCNYLLPFGKSSLAILKIDQRSKSDNFDFPPAITRPRQAAFLDAASNIVREVISHHNALRQRIEGFRRLRDQMNDSDERQRLRVVRED